MQLSDKYRPVDRQKKRREALDRKLAGVPVLPGEVAQCGYLRGVCAGGGVGTAVFQSLSGKAPPPPSPPRPTGEPQCCHGNPRALVPSGPLRWRDPAVPRSLPPPRHLALPRAWRCRDTRSWCSHSHWRQMSCMTESPVPSAACRISCTSAPARPASSFTASR